MKIISALIDFSDTSKIATQYAAKIAKREGATVNLLHITEQNEDEVSDIERELIQFTEIEKLDVPFTVSISTNSKAVSDISSP